jgi:hypothetical protein
VSSLRYQRSGQFAHLVQSLVAAFDVHLLELNASVLLQTFASAEPLNQRRPPVERGAWRLLL